MASPVQSRADLFHRLRARGPELREMGVESLELFGSFSSGTPGPDSDVDLLVQFEPGAKSYDAFLRLAEFLEEVLQRRVELVTTEGLSPHLGPRMLAEAKDVLARA